MLKFNKVIVIILIIFDVIILTGCGENESNNLYNTSAEQFNKIYFTIAKKLDLSSPDKFFKELQLDNNKKNITELGRLLENIKNSIPKNKEYLMDNFSERYNDLLFIKDSYSTSNELSIDDKRKIYVALSKIGYNLSQWEKSGTNGNWQ